MFLCDLSPVWQGCQHIILQHLPKQQISTSRILPGPCGASSHRSPIGPWLSVIDNVAPASLACALQTSARLWHRADPLLGWRRAFPKGTWLAMAVIACTAGVLLSPPCWLLHWIRTSSITQREELPHGKGRRRIEPSCTLKPRKDRPPMVTLTTQGSLHTSGSLSACFSHCQTQGHPFCFRQTSAMRVGGELLRLTVGFVCWYWSNGGLGESFEPHILRGVSFLHPAFVFFGGADKHSNSR